MDVQVEWMPYFENCVKDSCSCDTGGDCECFCTAVAAYAQACNEAGVCVAWRTPQICRKPLLLYNIQCNNYVSSNGCHIYKLILFVTLYHIQNSHIHVLLTITFHSGINSYASESRN